MKSYFALLTFCILIFSSCQDDANVFQDDEQQPLPSKCLAGASISDMAWLQVEIQQIEQSDISEYFYISEGEIAGIAVILLENCSPFCGTIIPVYDCEGKLLGTLGNGEDQIRGDELSNKRVIWQPQVFACSL